MCVWHDRLTEWATPYVSRLPQSRGVVRAAKRGVGRDRERATVLWGKTTRVSLELQ